MGKYGNDISRLLEAVGGRENISAVTHCMTRMRFVLADPEAADAKAIEALPSVKGTFTQAGQFQVIIGNDVAAFYQEFTALAGIEGVSKDAVKAAAKKNQNPLQRAMGVLGEIFAPIIPALICGGLILGFRNIIGEIRFFDNGTHSLADISQFWHGMYGFLWLIGEAVFHMLPVGIVWSITRKMGTTQILGIVLGLTLVSPQLLNAFAVASTPADKIPVWDFGFFSVQMTGYQGQVIAAILAGFVLVYLEKFFTRITPDVIKMIVVPFCSLIPAVIIAHTLVGPIGWWIGDMIAKGVYGGLMSSWGFLFAGVFGLLYAPVVMTGLHHMTNAIDSQLIQSFGGTILWPMIALSNIAQGSAVLAMSALQKKNERAEQVNVPAFISCYLGVTEPALFGVNLKYGFPLICGMIGSAVAAMISVGTGVTALSIGVGGLPGILSIRAEYYLAFLAAMAAAIVIPFILTYIVGKRKLSKADLTGENEEGYVAPLMAHTGHGHEQKAAKSAETVILKAYCDGKPMALEDVPDEVFSKRVMGDGMAILPSGDTVVAPAHARVAAVMPGTDHAVGLMLDNGTEILIHIGVDTVGMGGDGFETLVREGEIVEAGTPLLRFDSRKIKKNGLPDPVILVVTEGDAVVWEIPDGTLKAGKSRLAQVKHGHV